MKNIQFGLVFFVFLVGACGGGAPPDDYYPEEPQAAPAYSTEDLLPTPAMMPVNSPRPDQPVTVLTDTPDANNPFTSEPPVSPIISTPPALDPSIPKPIFSPILYRQYADRYYSYELLGGYQNGVWLNDEETLSLIEYERLVDVYEQPVGWFGNTTIHDVAELDPPVCGRYYIGSDLLDTSGWQFAFYQGWQVTLRPWQEIPTDSETYQTAVEDWLSLHGFSDPQVQISRILRVDLEGDGIDEVFISAAYFKTPNPQSPLAEFGDYSIVLMRKVFGNAVVTIPIIADLYHNTRPEPVFPFTFTLNGFLDLNQDGNLEVILDVTRWEGGGMVVYEVKDGNIIQVISEICME